MKLRINRLELLSGLNKVSKAVNAKTPLLALTGIKFTLTEDYLELIGSDSDTIFTIHNLKVRYFGLAIDKCQRSSILKDAILTPLHTDKLRSKHSKSGITGLDNRPLVSFWLSNHHCRD